MSPYSLILLIFLIWPSTAFPASQETYLSNQHSTEYPFTENKGQIIDQFNNPNNSVKFQFSSNKLNFQLKKNGFSIDLFKQSGVRAVNENSVGKQNSVNTYNFHRIDVVFVDANPDLSIIPGRKSENYTMFFNDHLPETGSGKVFNYDKVSFKGVYTGIDVVFMAKSGEQCSNNSHCVKYDFIVHPDGDFSDIKMQFEGAESLSLNEYGELVISTSQGQIVESIPRSFLNYEIENTVDFNYKINENQISFQTNETVPDDATLIIDPELEWGTYYGGTSEDRIYAIDVLENNNVIAVGQAGSVSNIATTGTHQSEKVGSVDLMMVKMDESGNRIWGTYMGGTGGHTWGRGAYVKNGIVWVVGRTTANHGLSTSGAHQENYRGSEDGFIAKFDLTGNREWCTYFGGNGWEALHGVVSDVQDNVYVAGYGNSSNGISTPGAHQVNKPGVGNRFDIYLAKFDAQGTIQWGTYFGGSGEEKLFSLGIDSENHIYLVGESTSNSNIASQGTHLTTQPGGESVIIVKFSDSGEYIWGTYFGGSSSDRSRAVDVDQASNIFITGVTKSQDGIATPGAHQISHSGGNDYDAFLAKFNKDGQRVWGTYYGGNNNDDGRAVSINSRNEITISGFTNSTQNIATSDAYQTSLSGLGDVFFAIFDIDGQNLYGSYFGGPGTDVNHDMVAKDESLFLSGWTSSTQKIATQGAHQANYPGGNFSAFITKFGFVVPKNLEIIAMNETNFCENDSVLLVIDYDNSEDKFENLQWLYNEDSIPNATNDEFFATETGYYSLVGRLPSNETILSNTISVEKFSNPVIYLPPDTTITLSDSVQINASITGGSFPYTYNWSPQAAISDHLVLQPFVSPLQNTTYNLKVTDQNGCTDEKSINITVLDNEGDTVFQTVPVKPTLAYASVSKPNTVTEVAWDYQNLNHVSKYILYRAQSGVSNMQEYAEIHNGSKLKYIDELESKIENVLCYQVRAVDVYGNKSGLSNPGCIILLEGEARLFQNTISWNPYIHWHDSVDHYIIHKSEDNEPYTVAGQTNGNSLSFTDTLLGDNIENYCYRVEAREAGGDAVSFSTEYCLKQPANVFIPNAFSPYMSPGLNDTFGPEGMFIAEFTMKIYSRWGQMIYETHNSEPWDGKLNNSYVESGAYIYQITITGYNGDKETYKGTVTITE